VRPATGVPTVRSAQINTENSSFNLPHLLKRFLEGGVWPTTNQNNQEITPLPGKDAAQKLSSDDDRIILAVPPFHSIGDEIRSGNCFWISGVTNPKDIDYEKALIIADFGIGSDSPIILYYENVHSPSVMFLQWSGNGQDVRHQWIETHSTFDQFACEIGLDVKMEFRHDED